jgi:hypothetical protein
MSTNNSDMQDFLNVGYKIIMSQMKGGLAHAATFELQYMPQFGKMTEMGPLKSVIKEGESLGSAHVKIWLSCVFVGLLAMASSVWYLHHTTDGALWVVVGGVVGEAVE